jgi:hypothetical protein
MPVYACFRGDCDNMALTEDNCFAVQDFQSRNWLCFETTANNLLAPETLIFQTVKAQQLLKRLGQASEGTQCSMHDCQDIDELKQALTNK